VCKESELARLKSIQAEVFKNGLKDGRRLMISGCGDPLASSLHRNFLLNIDRERYPDVRIKLQTNGLLLTPGMWAKIKNSHYAIDWISISIDAATEKTYKLNRGGSFDKLLRNLEFVSGLRKKNRIETFNINFVVQADNFREMKQFIELGKRYGCDYVVFQRIMNLGVDYGVNSDKNFKECAVHLETHPMNKEFLEVLKNPIFMESRIGLFKLLDFFPEEMRKRKDVDSITKYYPKCERNRIY
jgi:MoaA/NifB/PqqE/SkfB family radical SAM enzyme